MVSKYKIDAVEADIKNLTASFTALDKYSKAMRENQAQWKKYGDALKQAQQYQRELERMSKTYQMNLFSTNDETVRMSGALKIVNRTFASLAKDTKNIASNLNRILTGLMGFSVFSGLGMIAGLAGFAGGMFGLREASAAVAARRREAMGYGASYGAYSSYGVAFSRFGDPNAMLSNAFTGIYDIGSPQAIGLMSAGFTQRQLNRADTADVAAGVLESVPRQLAGVPERLIGPVAQSRRLTDHLSLPEIIRYLHSSKDERKEMIDLYKKGKKELALTPESQLKWTNFSNKISLAGTKIEVILGRKLAEFAPIIGKFSDAAVNLITALFESKAVAWALKEVKEGLMSFWEELNSEDFKNAMSEWLRALDVLLPFIGNLIKRITVAIAKWGFVALRILFDDSYTFGQAYKDIMDLVFGPVKIAPWRPEPPHSYTPQYEERKLGPDTERTPGGTGVLPDGSVIDPSTNEIVHPDGSREPFSPNQQSSTAKEPDFGKGPEAAANRAAWLARQVRQANAPWSEGIKWNKLSYQTSPNEPFQPELKTAMKKLHDIYGTYAVNSGTGGEHRGGTHSEGMAIDINTSGMSQAEYTRLITDAAKAGFHRFGISPSHLHVDMSNYAIRKGEKVRAFPDDSSVTGRYGMSVEQWNTYLNQVAGSDRKTVKPSSLYHPKWGHHTPHVSTLDHLQDVSQLPKRVVVENHTGSANTVHVRNIAFA